MGPSLLIQGVTFESVRAALTDLYFRTPNMTQEDFDKAARYVLPRQHNFMNPLKAEENDTYIQYWIDETDRLVEDRVTGDKLSVALKVAHITVSFIGRHAEEWAIAWHHLTQRESWTNILLAYCTARLLKYVLPITCRNVDYFGNANSAIEFITGFRVEYDEVIDLSNGEGGDPLEYVSIAPGDIGQV